MNNLFKGYHPVTWVVSGLIAIVGFPFMLVVPGYFYWKVRKGTASEQTPLETATVVFFNYIGIIGVEIWGRKGAIAVWVLVLFALISTISYGAAILQA